MWRRWRRRSRGRGYRECPRKARACPARSLAAAARLSFASQGAVLTAPRGVGDAAAYRAIRKPSAAVHACGRIWNPPLRTNKATL